ncbi:MAG TPA: prepilin-type N-terminal cleavage/methylation domain-containing protein [Terriglobales bacterium]|nr:prepilin-type N-terminal cleavage/methylation domain-containing protein [Terriglobales bacterium]
MKNTRGFTLVELMIVMAIIAILVGIAAPIYSQSLISAREAVLRQDLYHMRQAIDQFTMDKQRAPQSLDELVGAGYLRELPVDPFTKSRDTWEAIQEDTLNSIDQTQPGISDVRSGATGTALDGTAYNSW